MQERFLCKDIQHGQKQTNLNKSGHERLWSYPVHLYYGFGCCIQKVNLSVKVQLESSCRQKSFQKTMVDPYWRLLMDVNCLVWLHCQLSSLVFLIININFRSSWDENVYNFSTRKIYLFIVPVEHMSLLANELPKPRNKISQLLIAKLDHHNRI